MDSEETEDAVKEKNTNHELAGSMNGIVLCRSNKHKREVTTIKLYLRTHLN